MKLFSKKSSSDIPPRRRSTSVERQQRTVDHDQQQGTFRRNRTLVGSLSSAVSSVNEAGGDLQSSRTQAHLLATQRRKIGGVLMATLLMVVLLTGLLFDMTVKPIVSSADNAVTLDKSRYEKAITDYLSTHPLERLRVFLDRTQLNNYLRATVPEVVTVKQDGSAGLGATDFTVTMRHPIASWIIGGKQYFVDDQGVSFEKNYYETPTVSVVDQSGVQQSTGAAVASTRFLAFVGLTVSQATAQGLIVKQAIIPADTTRELEVMIAGHSYPIKLSLDRPVGEQVEDMKRAVGYFDTRQLTPQYVDVRVSGKAFYR